MHYLVGYANPGLALSRRGFYRVSQEEGRLKEGD